VLESNNTEVSIADRHLLPVVRASMTTPE